MTGSVDVNFPALTTKLNLLFNLSTIPCSFPLERPVCLSQMVFDVTYQTRESVSSGYPNTEKRVVENTTRSGVFLTKFEVFG